MSKSTRTTLIFLIVLGGLIAFTVYSNNAEKANATPTPSRYVWDMTADDIASIQIVDNAARANLTLTRTEDGDWEFSLQGRPSTPTPTSTGGAESLPATPPTATMTPTAQATLPTPTATLATTQADVRTPQPASAEKALQAASIVTTLSIRRTLTETTDLGQFGLLAPPYTINVTTTDGERLTLAVGPKTPTNDGYYVLRSGDQYAAIVSSSAIDTLIGFLTALPWPPTPTPTWTATPPVTETPATGTPG